ncbi:MAG: gamma-glutamyl-gamma-aminobutyrate hydrolase family protein [Janthinobacterium lividum]
MIKKIRKPIIGITLDLAKNSDQYMYSIFPWYAVRQNYADCIIKAGGLAIMIPYDPNSIDEIADLIDGLLIPGGDGDVNPKFYGHQIISDRVKVNDQRASFELELAKNVMERNMPLLGICNGMQVLNVACGGTLIQNIPDYIESSINHEQSAPKHIPSHSIDIKPNTILASMTDYNEHLVNSTHHQAIGEVSEHLIVSATAPDGIIEALESPNHEFVLGVEWHPEYLNSDLDFELFKRLVIASGNSKQ